MIEKKLISTQCIINFLHKKYPINVNTLTPLALGADIYSSVYKAQTYDHVSYFIKIQQGHESGINATLQMVLHEAGIPEIIAPLKTTKGHATCSINNDTFIVYPFIEGQNGFNQRLTNSQWITLGKALRRIHDFAIPPSMKDHIAQEMYSSQWRHAVRSMYDYLDSNPIVKGIARELVLCMEKNRHVIEQLVNGAQQLAEKIRQEKHTLVLCHADIHAGNVLIAQDDAIYIVDWDQPIMAPKERDLMFIGGGIANVWNNAHEEALFYQGYGTTSINYTVLAYYRYERIVEDIAIYSKKILLGSTEEKDKSEMYTHFLDMFNPNGAVDIAFKTACDVKLIIF